MDLIVQAFDEARRNLVLGVGRETVPVARSIISQALPFQTERASSRGISCPASLL